MMIKGHKQISYNVLSLNGMHEMHDASCTPPTVCVCTHMCTSQLEFCMYIQLQGKEFSQSLGVTGVHYLEMDLGG